jgi:hypothetical protein
MNHIPHGASVKVFFVADKLYFEAGHMNSVGSLDRATSNTFAVLPSCCLSDIFVRAFRTACANCLIGVIFEQVHVEVAAHDVKEEISDAERPPRVPGQVVFIDV